MSLRSSILRELTAGPQTITMLCGRLDADPRKVKRTLKALAKDNKVSAVRGTYQLRPKTAIKLKGRPAPKTDGTPISAMVVKLGRSFGFAAPLDGSPDIFVPGRNLLGALPGDKVEIELFTHPRVAGSREGAVVKILEPRSRIVGTLEQQGGRLVLVSDDFPENPILIKKNEENGAVPGEKVAVELLLRGEDHAGHRAGVTMRFGVAESAKDSAEAIVYAAGVEKEFPPQVLQEAKKLADYTVTENDLKNRLDLRENTIFTIDSAFTKDIDDAISITRTQHGYALGVHIADVSHFVRPGSPLNEDALGRGTSIYYGDSVIPMLPKELSNGICSLNPNEDRLAFSCLMELDKDGRITGHSFHKSVVSSRIKGVYNEINALFDETGTAAQKEKYAVVAQDLAVMRELYEKLAVLRTARGNLEIESEEAYFVLDEDGRCIGVERRTRGIAERMIEEFMLLANQAAAATARRLEIPFVYRVHEKPSDEKIEQLKAVLQAANVPFEFVGHVPTQEELAKILNETRGTPMERFVHTGVLRGMMKAKYEPLPKGHFGLALEDYAHFTSPIRRYPDLAIHRILSDVTGGAAVKEIRKKYAEFAQAASLASSERELTAQRIERNCDDCYKAEYMKQFVGQKFTGVVSSVVPFGIYVELENSIEGMVHISKLAAGQMDLADGISLSDPLTGKKYRIGDTVTVLMENANISRGTIDFDIVE